jgi:alpha-glucosidase
MKPDLKKDKYSVKYYPTEILRHEQKNNYFWFYTADIVLELRVVSDTIIRFRYAVDGFFQRDFSYAISEDFHDSNVHIRLREDKLKYEIITPSIVCRIIKKTMKRTIFNRKKQIILEDEPGFHWQHYIKKGGKINYCSVKIQEGEHFYGLGDKPTKLDLRGKYFENFGADVYGFQKDSDPLYKNIPFYYGLHHNFAYGIFFDNSFRTIFDFGHEKADVCSFWARGGEMNFYFIYGPEVKSVAEQYASITGVAEMPPLWALGYQQSKWSYFPEKQVKEIAGEFRKREIPCDVIHLDIDYMDGFRVFTWDKKKFPDPGRMIRQLQKQGFKVVTIIDPGVKVDKAYKVYKEAIEKNYLCRRADGDLMEGDVWPGKCNFPDFTNPKVRQWWSTLFEDLIRAGVRGVWNDMNEPAVFEIGTFPEDVRHHYDGDECSHRKAHNIYGMQMARATLQGLKKFLGDKRPLNITRSGFSGVQRYASVWTGDNSASWEHLWLANLQCQRLSMSGISFAGSDIGGFIGNPDGELYVRWLQMAIFHPFCRTHSAGLDRDSQPHEPWVYGPRFEFIARKFINLRYQLLPYIYTAFWQQYQKGTPVLRSPIMYDQTDPEVYHRMEEFFLGDKMLICPVSRPGVDSRRMYLPKGKWYNFWTDALEHGGKEFITSAPLDQCPVFIHEGSVIPNFPKMQYVGETKITELILHIYFASRSQESELFEDDYDGYGYQNGKFNICKFAVHGNKNQFKIYQAFTSDYTPSYEFYKIVIHGLPFVPDEYMADGKLFKLSKKNYALGTVKFRVPRKFEEIILNAPPYS